MNKETLEKAIELKEKINFYGRHINALNYTKVVKNGGNKRRSENAVGLLRFANRFNLSGKNEPEQSAKAQVILFNNYDTKGYYDIEVDEELINIIVTYYLSKKEKLEKELEEL